MRQPKLQLIELALEVQSLLRELEICHRRCRCKSRLRRTAVASVDSPGVDHEPQGLSVLLEHEESPDTTPRPSPPREQPTPVKNPEEVNLGCGVVTQDRIPIRPQRRTTVGQLSHLSVTTDDVPLPLLYVLSGLFVHKIRDRLRIQWPPRQLQPIWVPLSERRATVQVIDVVRAQHTSQGFARLYLGRRRPLEIDAAPQSPALARCQAAPATREMRWVARARLHGESAPRAGGQQSSDGLRSIGLELSAKTLRVEGPPGSARTTVPFRAPPPSSQPQARPGYPLPPKRLVSGRRGGGRRPDVAR